MRCIINGARPHHKATEGHLSLLLDLGCLFKFRILCLSTHEVLRSRWPLHESCMRPAQVIYLLLDLSCYYLCNKLPSWHLPHLILFSLAPYPEGLPVALAANGILISCFMNRSSLPAIWAVLTIQQLIRHSVLLRFEPICTLSLYQGCGLSTYFHYCGMSLLEL